MSYLDFNLDFRTFCLITVFKRVPRDVQSGSIAFFFFILCETDNIEEFCASDLTLMHAPSCLLPLFSSLSFLLQVKADSES